MKSTGNFIDVEPFLEGGWKLRRLICLLSAFSYWKWGFRRLFVMKNLFIEALIEMRLMICWPVGVQINLIFKFLHKSSHKKSPKRNLGAVNFARSTILHEKLNSNNWTVVINILLLINSENQFFYCNYRGQWLISCDLHTSIFMVYRANTINVHVITSIFIKFQ